MKKTSEINGKQQKKIWGKFFKMLALAKIPYWALALYVILNFASIYLALLIPQLYGAFYQGDVSEESVGSMIASELGSMAMVGVIFLIRYYVNSRIDRNFRNAIWKKMLSLPPRFFDELSGNTLVSRITSDAEGLRSFLIDVVISEALSISSAIATVASMTTIRPQLAIIMAVMIPVIILTGFVFGRIKMKVSNLLKGKMAEMTGNTSAQLSAVKVIKAYSSEDHETKRGEEGIRSYYRAEVKQRVIELLQGLASTLIGFLPQIALILIGIKLLDERQLTVAGWVTFLSYATSLITFFNEKAGVWTNIKDVQGQLIRVSDIMDHPGEQKIPYTVEDLQPGELRFDHVSFSYDEKQVLKDVSFRIPQNEVTLLMGRSGCGKSTTVKLIERMYDVQDGGITVGGTPLMDGNIKNWRKHIAVVAQDVPMFSGTLRENILYGIEKEVSDAEILEAAKLLNVQGLLGEKGLDGEAGQFGEKLSGGQRQILSILRAYLQGKDYIILDEPTASLDLRAKREVMNALKVIKERSTVIMIAHDRMVVDDCGYFIIYEDDGTVTEGTREEVSSRSAYFTNAGQGEEE